MPVVLGVVAVAAASSPAPDSIERRLKLKHRRKAHRPALQLTFIGIWTYALAMVMQPYPLVALVIGAGLAIGCVMHSIADSMTVDREGIQLLWPLSRRGYHLLPWKLRVWVGTKSRSERLFVVVWMAFVLIYAYARFGSLISA